MKNSLPLLAFVALLSLTGCATTPSSGWVPGAPEKIVASPKPGTNLQSVASPDGRFTLIVRDEAEQGDFVWHALYLKSGGAFTLLGSFNSVKDIAWSPDSTTVSFRTEKAVEYNKVEESDCQYAPITRSLKSRRIKTTQVER